MVKPATGLRVVIVNWPVPVFAAEIPTNSVLIALTSRDGGLREWISM
jgi:hypothetical protein